MDSVEENMELYEMTYEFAEKIHILSKNTGEKDEFLILLVHGMAASIFFNISGGYTLGYREKGVDRLLSANDICRKVILILDLLQFYKKIGVLSCAVLKADVKEIRKCISKMCQG